MANPVLSASPGQNPKDEQRGGVTADGAYEGFSI
jgi:hypothetical protein